MTPYNNEPTKRAWKRLFLRYFDINDDSKISWWEVAIPVIFLLFIEVIGQLIAQVIINLL